MLPFICIFFDFFLHCLTVFQVQVFYHLGKIYARSVIWPGQVAARTPLTWATPVTDSKPGAPMPSPKADTQRGWSVCHKKRLASEGQAASLEWPL